MLKKASLFFIVCVLLFCITGCFDAREIDDEVYAISIGIDYGKENKIRLTIQFPIYTDSGGDSGGGSGMSSSGDSEYKQGQNLIHTIEAPTILEAVDLFGMSTSRRISLMHAKFLFFSEEVARDGISKYVQAFSRFSETRPSMVVVIVNGKAEDFILKNVTNIGGTISKAMELLFNRSEDVGYFPRAFLHNFAASKNGYYQPVAIYGGINNFELFGGTEDQNKGTRQASQSLFTNAEPDSGDDEIIDSGKSNDNNENEDNDNTNSDRNVNNGHKPGKLPRKGADIRELVGTAVFREDKMVGSLDEYETVYYLIAINKHESGSYTIIDKKDKDSLITFNIKSNGVKVSVNLDNKDKPIIDMKIAVEADIKTIQSSFNYERLDLIEELNNHLAERLLEGINNVIEKTQKEFKSDIFGIGKKVAAKFLTIQEWQEYNWLEKYPQADINVSVKVNIRRTGSMIQSSK